MKNFPSLLGAALLFASSLPAQETVVTAPAPDEPAPMDSTVALGTLLDNTQLDQLLGSIALYPDALVALILPASTNSSDIVLAARYLRAGGDPAKIDEQPWDDSVRSLARYPDVVKWMDDNLSWTKQLGEVFVAQPADVMKSLQRLRLKARSVGSLVDNPQQQVVYDNATSTITIVPTQPDVIYVPAYDPTIVYISRPTYYTSPYFTYGPAYATGFWLSYNVDWHHHRVWCVDRPYRQTYWHEHRHHWHQPKTYRPSFASHTDYYRPWTPRPTFTASRSFNYARHNTINRPRYNDGRVNSGGSDSHWDRNSTRPARGTGERFRRTSSTDSAAPGAASAVQQLPLADPLPIALPSPLPEAPQLATPSANRNESSRGRGNRGFRNDHGSTRTVNLERGSDISAQPRAVDSTGHRSSIGRTNARPSYNPSRNVPTATLPASPSTSTPAATVPVPSYSRGANPNPPAVDNSPNRGTENRRFDSPGESPRGSRGGGGGRERVGHEH